MKKRRGIFIFLFTLILLSVFMLGAGSIRKIKVTIGGGNQVIPAHKSATIDLHIPVKIPITIELEELSGCSSVPRQVKIEVSGTAHIFYDQDTGSSFFRLEELHYEVIIGDDGKTEVKKT